MPRDGFEARSLELARVSAPRREPGRTKGRTMAYRRTERVIARLAARQEAIVAAARALASESGMAAVQIVPVAERAGIAAGTVYRYLPSKDDLVAALVGAGSEQEIAAIGRAAA